MSPRARVPQQVPASEGARKAAAASLRPGQKVRHRLDGWEGVVCDPPGALVREGYYRVRVVAGEARMDSTPLLAADVRMVCAALLESAE